jgi:LmbE family N-acetylglucosaminyl deacetylase
VRRRSNGRAGARRIASIDVQLPDLAALSAPYRLVCIAPHLDDAALSLGGMLAAPPASAAPALVITLCTAAPTAAYNAVAREFHGQWDLESDDIVGQRKREDVAAMATLGVDFVWLEVLDAIYRCPAAYHSRETLFAAPQADDPLILFVAGLFATLRRQLPQAQIAVPLGVGEHVDHLICFAAARQLLGDAVWYYEDIPYALRPGALERRLSALDGRWTSRPMAIDDGLAAKIAAIGAYRSQIGELFGGMAPMASQIRDYAATVAEAGGVAERAWRVAL